MTLKEVKERVMAYMDEVYSENMLSELGDDRFRLPSLIDSTQREIAALALPIKKECAVLSCGGVITLPEDTYEPINLIDTKGRFVSFKDFAPGKLRVKSDGDYTLFYNAYPERITGDTPEDYELTLPPAAQDALVFGVCAALYMNTEPKLYSDFMDRYTSYLNNIISKSANMPFIGMTGGDVL